ncbi:MAG: hypothetical protein FJX75_16260 [Armatimonadetes bacterium]|nr:hypothetical protein [Armatimonadota bacterium]
MPYHPSMLIIGLDGADFVLAQEWMREGRLPALRALAAGGRWGRLESTMPPVTAPAWTTMYTGVTPEQHGLHDFWGVVAADAWAPLFADQCTAATLWKALNAAGRSVGLLNLPWTYPVEKLDRYCVAGLSPVQDARACHPPEVYGQIRAWYPDWEAETPAPRAWGEDAGRQIRDLTDREGDIASRLVRHWQPDVAMLVLCGPDRVVHATADEAVWRDVYQGVDETIGRLVDEFGGPHTHVAIVSDHGGRKAQYGVNLVRVFAEAGLLVPKGGPLTETVWGGCWAAAGRMARWMTRVGLLPTGQAEALRRTVSPPRRLSLDWSRTAAFPYAPARAAAAVRINLAGRDPEGWIGPDEYRRMRARLIELLRSLKGPDQTAVFQHVGPSDPSDGDAPRLGPGPDVVGLPNEAYWLEAPLEHRGSGGAEVAVSPAYFTLPVFRAGEGARRHTMDGVWVLHGPTVQPGVEEGARIVDVAPTLLYALDVPIPGNMEGRVLEASFGPEVWAQRAVKRQPALEPAERVAGDLTAEEAEGIARHLADLGYLE